MMLSAVTASSIYAGHSDRIAITGIGMVTPAGPDRESSWQGLIAGRRYLRWLTETEHRLAGCDPARTRLAGAPVDLRKASQDVNELPLCNRTSVSAQPGTPASAPPSLFDAMLFQAADEAAFDAGFSNRHKATLLRQDLIESHRIGLVIGTSKGSLVAIRESYLRTARERRNPATSSRTDASHDNTWPGCWPDAPASHLAARWDIRGPVLSPVAACATGMASLCRGAELIRDGVCDVVFAGSVDDSLAEIVWGSYRRLGVLSRIPNDDPSCACRPFDRDRTGFLMGSGAAVIVLERWDLASARGKRPYAEWLAGGILSDATALTQVSSDAAGLTRLITDLLRRGNIRPHELDYINLHGTGTRDNDRFETLGIRHALGSAADQVACSSLKGAIGHLLGGAGSVEFAATVLALRDGIIPPTCNLEHAAPECDLNYTPLAACRKNIQTALKLSLGFGGHLVGGLIRRARTE